VRRRRSLRARSAKPGCNVPPVKAFLGLVTILAAACSAAPQPAPAPLAAHPPIAPTATVDAAALAPPPPPSEPAVCFTNHRMNRFVGLTPGPAGTVVLCVEQHPRIPEPGDGELHCASLALASGTYSPVAPPAPITPAPLDVRVEQDAKSVRVCTAAGCTKLATKPPPKVDGAREPYEAAVSADGKRVALAGGKHRDVAIFDAQTGKKTMVLDTHLDRDYRAERPVFLGASLFFTMTVPGQLESSRGYLFDAAGVQLEDVIYRATAGPVRAFQTLPIALAGDAWLLEHRRSPVVLDASTGEVVRTTELPPECDECYWRAPWDTTAFRMGDDIVMMNGQAIVAFAWRTGELREFPAPRCPNSTEE
jgi:hypothetical protein